MLDGDERPWFNSRLTISFAPDGADLAGTPSSLFAEFDALAPRDQWQTTILSAFQAWLPFADVQIAAHSDDGSAFGAPGPKQGDPRFGDVRIGARSLAENLYATSVPYDAVVSGTWAGDVLFNADAAWSSLDELYGVALHEAGHVLGLDHSPDPASVMHEHGVPDQLALNLADQAALAALFGPRRPDVTEEAGWQETVAYSDEVRRHAFGVDALSLTGGVEGSAPSIVHADLDGAGDVDWFRVERPDGYTGDLTVFVQSSALSLVRFQAAAFNRDGDLLASELGGYNAGDAATLHLSGSDEDYYIRIVAQSDARGFDTGMYSATFALDDLLAVSWGDVVAAGDGRFASRDAEDLVAALAAGDAYLVDSEMEIENGVPQVQLTSDENQSPFTRYALTSSLASIDDVDRFLVQTPTDGAGPYYLQVAVAAGLGLEAPRVVLYADEGTATPSKVLLAGREDFVIETSALPADAKVVIEVRGRGAASIGDYALTAVVTQQPTELEVFDEQSFTGEAQRALHVHRPQLLQFTLEASGGEVRADLLDSGGATLATWTAADSDAASPAALFLSPGDYRIRYHTLSAQGAVQVRLLGLSAAGPFSTLPIDPSNQPECPSGLDVFCSGGDYWFFPPSVLLGDLDQDGDVDLTDWVVFKGQFGFQGQNLVSDLNGDEQVDLGDFFLFKSAFGSSN